ncbi:MAG: hypothetical protein CBC01_09405 [Betaproteobacteria bacterium TMED41]|nr:MAG: hypothetical protein CBC01_09405 [Betaproteobacteria bacterium TMED41]
MVSHLQLRGSCFYVRLGIPKTLQAHFKKRELKRSLQTSDISIAKSKSLELVKKWKSQFEELKHSQSMYKETVSQIIPSHKKNNFKKKSFSEVIHKPHNAQSHIIKESVNKSYDTNHINQTPFLLYKNAFFEQWQVHDKTKQMADTVLRRVSKIFPNLECVSRTLVLMMINHDENTPKTKLKNYGFVHKYWEFLTETKVISINNKNPFSRLEINVKKNISPRKAFSINDIKKLHKLAQIKKDDQLADLIFFATYTAARIEEICQLKTTDIVQLDGYSCINIRNSRTSTINRTIPIHPSLQSLIGKMMNRRNDGFLVAMQNKNKFGMRSNALGKRFTRLKKELGYNHEYVFHSIRKTVIDIFKSNEIKEGLVAKIIGHNKSNIDHNFHKSECPVQSMFEAIEKIKL